MSKPKTQVTQHPFLADPDLADPRMGVQVCTRCRLVGRAGDSHHDMPAAVPDGQSRAAGEGRPETHSNQRQGA